MPKSKAARSLIEGGCSTVEATVPPSRVALFYGTLKENSAQPYEGLRRVAVLFRLPRVCWQHDPIGTRENGRLVI